MPCASSRSDLLRKSRLIASLFPQLVFFLTGYLAELSMRTPDSNGHDRDHGMSSPRAKLTARFWPGTESFDRFRPLRAT
jgi:hypothetical protein